MKLQAFQQGHLDRLCGVYALLNAYRQLCPDSRQGLYRNIFNEAMAWLDSRRELLPALRQGTNINQLLALNKQVLQPHFPGTQTTRPFLRKMPHSEKALLAWFDTRVNRAGNTLLVLRGISGDAHWTV